MSPKPTQTNIEGPPEFNRRVFLKRLGAASVLAAGAAVLSGVLLDREGPPAGDGSHPLDGLGNFARADLAGERGKMALVHGTDRAAMLERGIQALGGIDSFIAKGDRVLLKVNAAFATPPTLCATTHPDLVTAVAGLCLKAGASHVAVTDNPINNPQSCFAISGIGDAARAAGAKVLLPRADFFLPATVPGGQLIRNWPVMAEPFKGITKVIAISPVKDHHRAGASMSLKNFYGLLGGQRNVFHQDINGIVAELSTLIRPTLVVLDGTVSMMTNGPTGGSLSDLKATNLLIVSTDPVAADAVGVELLGRSLSDVPYIRMAQDAGSGLADYAKLNPVRIDLGV